MNKFLLDIVNLNLDASCLSSKRWISILEGGNNSFLYNWLKLYVDYNKRIILGLTGATISDMATNNPETIELVRRNRDIFEIILRPYSHDISLIRSPLGFRINVELGQKIIKREFNKYSNFYLPPEFMLTNEFVSILAEIGVDGVFINSNRFKDELKKRIPNTIYMLKGIMNKSLICIPCLGELTNLYLESIHNYSTDKWNVGILKHKLEYIYSWRDGESSFFIPDGLEREKQWLISESSDIKRIFLAEHLKDINFQNINDDTSMVLHYPIHSFYDWMKEFSMLGFVKRIQSIEANLPNISVDSLAIWLQIINSDILSSVEKDSPIINLKTSKNSNSTNKHTIWRSERGFEGEEFIKYFELIKKNETPFDYFKTCPEPHLIKLRNRMNYLKSLMEG